MRQLIRLNITTMDGKMAPYIVGIIYPDERLARVSELYVPESERGKGYGKMLMEMFETTAANRLKAPFRICLMSLVSAVPFYEKLGYHLSRDFFFEMEKEIIEVETIA